MLSRYKVLILLLFGILTTSVQAALPLHDSNGTALPSLSPMLKRVNPAVVNISTFSTTQEAYNPLMNDPFFRHFFQIPEQQRQQKKPQKRQRSAGSGVIIDRTKGLVITNHHVVNNADEVHIALIDGRSFPAKIIGRDPELDIALLQIKADNLSQVPLANSDILEVGDFAVAIGNPFGLGQTVTTGIISALGRTGLGIEGYENFIQTDASINPGNSGGALVNLQGQLIGINTAIIAPSGGNVGIGFAIPINMVKASIKQIQQYGEVKRGRIGVTIQDINIELRKAFNLKNGQQGVLVTGVVKNSAAQKAGIQQGDVIVSVDNKPTKSSGELRSRIGIKAIGDQINVTVIRKGNLENFSVKVSDPKQGTVQTKKHQLLEGMQLEDNGNGQGVLIVGMKPNSFAVYSGLRPGDIILGANRQKVSSIDGLNKALQKASKKILLRINRKGRLFYLVIR
ncbi:MAG: DegQ family serine endoprotease [Methylococcales bacterium]|nr:DegQ family serine endoprotease [Methylococcales bacterium]